MFSRYSVNKNTSLLSLQFPSSPERQTGRVFPVPDEEEADGRGGET